MQGSGRSWMIRALLACVLSSAGPAAAEHVATLRTMTVTGVVPGPGLWKVSRGDHVLWVLGTLEILPAHVQWSAHQVRERIAQAQEVLGPPTVHLHAEAPYYGRLALDPSGKSLREQMPAQDYAKWLPLKAQYLGQDDDVERYRPIFAAVKLYLAALAQADLAEQVTRPVIQDAREHSHAKWTPIYYHAEVRDPTDPLRNAGLTQADNLRCFEQTLDHLQEDVTVMRERANAWSIGDLTQLQKLPTSDQLEVCRAAIAESGIAHKLDADELRGKFRELWVAAASKALNDDKVSFALLPMGYVLGPDSYLKSLQAEGDRIEPPKDFGAVDANDAP